MKIILFIFFLGIIKTGLISITPENSVKKDRDLKLNRNSNKISLNKGNQYNYENIEALSEKNVEKRKLAKNIKKKNNPEKIERSLKIEESYLRVLKKAEKKFRELQKLIFSKEEEKRDLKIIKKKLKKKKRERELLQKKEKKVKERKLEEILKNENNKKISKNEKNKERELFGFAELDPIAVDIPPLEIPKVPELNPIAVDIPPLEIPCIQRIPGIPDIPDMNYCKGQANSQLNNTTQNDTPKIKYNYKSASENVSSTKETIEVSAILYKAREEKIDNWVKEQLTEFDHWHEETSQKIISEIDRRSKKWLKNDEKNRKYNEKFYQLELFQEIEKKKLLGMILNMSFKLKDALMTMTTNIINGLNLRLSITIMNVKLVNEDKHRDKIFAKMRGDDNQEEFERMDRDMMHEVLENELEADGFME